MGKTPGKWIKTKLLGKKSSKTNSKGKFVPNTTNEKETWIAAKEPTTDLPVDPPLVSEPTPGTTDRNEGITVLEKGITSSTTHDEGGMLLQDQDMGRQETIVYGALDDPERIKLEQAATKAQAAFRGYLARRAFWVLRGIIRLQALVRGHLVRRQAVATLCCMQGIIKFQVLIRGRRVKHSDAGLEVHKRRSLGKPLGAKGLRSTSTQISRLSRNAFVCKLLRSSPTGMPLRLQYDPDEPNSAWNWLERWTLSRFWEPLSLSKKVLDQKSQSRQATLPNVETEPTKSRRTFRKGPAAHTENGLVHSTSETEKPKRNVKKILSHPVDPVVEHPQSELEKVKRNLRKVSSSMLESTDRQEVDTEKPKRIMKKASNIPAPEIVENGTSDSEKMKEYVALPKEPDVETVSIPFVSDEPIAVSHDDHPQIDLPPLENVGLDSGNSIMTDGELIPKEEKTSHDNQKTTKRRASFPAKQETPENGSQSTPKVPSYMAATESAKAKLRAQGSPRSAPDLPEKNGFTRRYSLPSSTAGKLNSLSPRTQRPVQTNGKGGTKNDKSLLASRDGNDKVVQAEWRR